MIPAPPPNLVEWLVLLGLFAGAVTGVVGALTWIGRFVWRNTIEPRLSRIEDRLGDQCERLKAIERQVTPNGVPALLPEHQRGLGLRDLLVTHIVETAPLIRMFVEEHQEPHHGE